MDRAEQVRRIFSARGLTLYNVSLESARVFGRSSRFYIPHNLYGDLSESSVSPTIHQMLALSRITNYRLNDWLAAFGFDLGVISQLRLQIPRRRTTLLDSTIYDMQAWIPWFAWRGPSAPTLPIAPLGQYVARALPRRLTNLLGPSKKTFLYAVVGDGDLPAASHFAPGSVVRADSRRAAELQRGTGTGAQKPFFLVEHDSGCNCSQIAFLGRGTILLHSPQYLCAQRELRLGREARILGVIDAEIRPVGNHRTAAWASAQLPLREPRPRPGHGQQANLKNLLRNSRIQAGLSFRDASSLSRWIARTLSDELYFAAGSTLSDYETLSVPPRHIQKIMTLCILYCVDFRQFLRVCGVSPDGEGQEPIPDELIPRNVPSLNYDQAPGADEETHEEHPGFLVSMVEEWQEVPLFLRHSLELLTGIKNFSLSDVFWVGGDKAPIHPLLINAAFIAVNRRIKKPVHSFAPAVCTQPIYLILKRDGTYLCGRCVLERENLIVHSYPGAPLGIQRFRNGVGAEVVGQVTTILRRLL